MRVFHYQVFLAALLISAAAQSQNSFLERSRNAYESMPPSQREQIEEAVRTGKQINLQPNPMTTTSGGGQSGGLLALKGLTCNEWSKNKPIVRQSWLDQYLDTTSSRERNPMTIDRKHTLARVDDYCKKKPSELAEVSIAAAYREFEAEAIQKKADRAALAEASNARYRAKQEAEEAAQLLPENNPLLSSQAKQLSCHEWKNTDLGRRQYWLRQYLKEKDVYSAPKLSEQNARLFRICTGYLKLPAIEAVRFVTGAASSANEESQRTEANNTEPQSGQISWKAKLQVRGFDLRVAGIDQKMLAEGSETAALTPGLHAFAYSCSGKKGSIADVKILDVLVRPDAEYFVTVITHDPNQFPSNITVETGRVHGVATEYPSAVVPTCSAVAYECKGKMYVEPSKREVVCEANKRSTWQSFLNASSYWAIE